MHLGNSIVYSYLFDQKLLSEKMSKIVSIGAIANALRFFLYTLYLAFFLISITLMFKSTVKKVGLTNVGWYKRLTGTSVGLIGQTSDWYERRTYRTNVGLVQTKDKYKHVGRVHL